MYIAGIEQKRGAAHDKEAGWTTAEVKRGIRSEGGESGCATGLHIWEGAGLDGGQDSGRGQLVCATGLHIAQAEDARRDPGVDQHLAPLVPQRCPAAHERRGIGMIFLERNWLQPQLVKPGRRTNLVVESRRAPADHLHFKNSGRCWSCEIIPKVRSWPAANELAEDHVQACRPSALHCLSNGLCGSAICEAQQGGRGASEGQGGAESKPHGTTGSDDADGTGCIRS